MVKKNHKFFFGIIILLTFIVIMVLPGILSVEVIAHELYHVYKNSQYAKEICVDINAPYKSHVYLLFENGTTELSLASEEHKAEELMAERVGEIASIAYVFLSLVAIGWVIFFAAKRLRS
ncbi:hypothetical protein HY643_00595 [Candidatus Woesearchaeota archaeon]|nr:hypothetical protein [Candidatus Woesearchaeota archaeon]